ncbi:hypothetical protein SAMN03159379_04617, partial [Variovorax sp. NFACC26]
MNDLLKYVFGQVEAKRLSLDAALTILKSARQQGSLDSVAVQAAAPA